MKRNPGGSHVYSTLVAGGLAGLSGWAVAIPMDVVKNRHQGRNRAFFEKCFFGRILFYANQIFNLTPYMTTFTRKAPESRPSSARPHLFIQLDPSFGRRACAGSTAAERSRWYGPSPRTPPPSSVTRRLSGCWPRAPCSESSDDRSQDNSTSLQDNSFCERDWL